MKKSANQRPRATDDRERARERKENGGRRSSAMQVCEGVCGRDGRMKGVADRGNGELAKWGEGERG